MKTQMIMLVDLDRCIGCRGGCQVACKSEHNIALGDSRSKLYTIGPEGKYPDLQMYFIPVMCQQCENPSCAAVCPTGACHKRMDDGVIVIDQDRCIGCGSCKNACPYQTILLNQEMRVMDKCTLCLERRLQGEVPACVKNCSGRALIFGDINNSDSEVSRAIHAAGTENVYSFPDFGNRPKGCFILRNAKWNQTLPHLYTAEREKQ